MSRQDGVESILTGLGELFERSPPVGFARPPANEAVLLEPVDDPGDTAGGDVRLGRKVGHSKGRVRGAAEPKDHLELERLEVMLRDLLLELLAQAEKGLGEQTDRGDPWIITKRHRSHTNNC